MGTLIITYPLHLLAHPQAPRVQQKPAISPYMRLLCPHRLESKSLGISVTTTTFSGYVVSERLTSSNTGERGNDDDWEETSPSYSRIEDLFICFLALCVHCCDHEFEIH